MVVKFSDLDINGTFSYADYLTWKFEERVELIKGRIFKMSPAPSVRHQKVASHLAVEIGWHFKKLKCEMYISPFDVRLTDSKKKVKKSNQEIHTVVQPDICVICDESKLDEKGCIGAPDWIIEIVSPGSQKHDLKYKFRLYEENGVKEYWVVNPLENFIQAYSLQPDGKYGNYRIFTDEEDFIVSPDLFPDLKIDLKEIFT